jgi:PAS domain S-box-containing protein
MANKFITSIVFRIWFPFALFIGLFIVFSAWWYPNKQSSTFKQNSSSQWRIIANNVAMGVEMSFKYEDFSMIQKSIEVATNNADLEFVAIIEYDELGQSQVLVSNPPDYEKSTILNPDTSNLSILLYPINVEGFQGYVVLANSYESIEEELLKLNFPIILFLLGLLIFGLAVFYLMARDIAKPIRRVTKFATELQKRNYNLPITLDVGRDEISALNNSLFNLQISLKEAEVQSREFNEKLENQIEIRTQDLYARTEELLQAQRVAMICSIEIDLQNGIMGYSDTFNEVLNLRLDHASNIQDFVQLMDNEDKDAFVQKISKIKESQAGSIEMDFRLLLPGFERSRWYMIQVNVQKSTIGRQILKGIIQDIDTRKTNEELLNRLSLVAKKTTNCVIITDVNRKMVWVNDSLIRLSGYSREELIGKSPKIFQFEKTDQQTLNFIQKELYTKHQVQAEVLNRGKFGNEYWLKLDILAMRDNAGAITGYMAVEIDITDAKAKEAEVKHLLSITQSQNNRLLDFAHIVSHNLRSHSSNFDMLIQLLAAKFDFLKQETVFHLLNKASDNLGETINHLREIVSINENIESGKGKIDLSDVLSKVIVNTCALASKENVEVINELHEPLLVDAIPAYADSILLNLMTNAIKYKAVDRKAYIRIYGKKEDIFTSIYVEDNGLGIDLELHREKLFGMYKRFHHHKEARGLGLFITKNHIEVMGGMIEVKSEVNVGSTFIARFRNEKIQYNLVD